MPTEIVKVQRPVKTNDPTEPWLIYDRRRNHEVMVPAAAIPEHVKKALGDDFKGYFTGAWSSVVGWGLSARVAAQEW
jgi:hypothetical protein